MKKWSRVYLLIIKFIAIIQGPTTKWVFYAWIDLKQNIVVFTTLNSLPDIFKVNVSLQCSIARYTIFIWKNIKKYWCWAPLWLFFFLKVACNCGFSSVTVFGFECFALKFPIISFVVIIRIIRNVIVSWIYSW